jgi:hypothetical protein
MKPLEFAILLTLVRYVYLSLPVHETLWDKSGGMFNGYVLLAAGAYALKIPIPLIVALVVGRKIYKDCVGHEVAEDLSKPHSHIMFFLASYICGYVKR